MVRPPTNLLGRRFGRWLVVDWVPPERKKYSWRCRCDCGNYADVLAGNLTSGMSTQCRPCGNRAIGNAIGDSRQKDLTGRIFGRWTVLEKSHVGAGRNVYWLCRCTCGTQGTIAGGSLRSGRSRQCRDCANQRRGERP